MRLFFLKSYEQETAWFVDKTAVGKGCRRSLREHVKQIVNRFRVQGYNGIKKRIHKTDGFCNARYLAERKEQEAERKEWEAEMKA